eukprot:Clim_evm2s184 gene=Clim_evmTU2s184
MNVDTFVRAVGLGLLIAANPVWGRTSVTGPAVGCYCSGGNDDCEEYTFTTEDNAFQRVASTAIFETGLGSPCAGSPLGTDISFYASVENTGAYPVIMHLFIAEEGRRFLSGLENTPIYTRVLPPETCVDRSVFVPGGDEDTMLVFECQVPTVYYNKDFDDFAVDNTTASTLPLVNISESVSAKIAASCTVLYKLTAFCSDRCGSVGAETIIAQDSEYYLTSDPEIVRQGPVQRIIDVPSRLERCFLAVPRTGKQDGDAAALIAAAVNDFVVDQIGTDPLIAANDAVRTILPLPDLTLGADEMPWAYYLRVMKAFAEQNWSWAPQLGLPQPYGNCGVVLPFVFEFMDDTVNVTECNDFDDRLDFGETVALDNIEVKIGAITYISGFPQSSYTMQAANEVYLRQFIGKTVTAVNGLPFFDWMQTTLVYTQGLAPDAGINFATFRDAIADGIMMVQDFAIYGSTMDALEITFSDGEIVSFELVATCAENVLLQSCDDVQTYERDLRGTRYFRDSTNELDPLRTDANFSLTQHEDVFFGDPDYNNAMGVFLPNVKTFVSPDGASTILVEVEDLLIAPSNIVGDILLELAEKVKTAVYELNGDVSDLVVDMRDLTGTPYGNQELVITRFLEQLFTPDNWPLDERTLTATYTFDEKTRNDLTNEELEEFYVKEGMQACTGVHWTEVPQDLVEFKLTPTSDNTTLYTFNALNYLSTFAPPALRDQAFLDAWADILDAITAAETTDGDWRLSLVIDDRCVGACGTMGTELSLYHRALIVYGESVPGCVPVDPTSRVWQRSESQWIAGTSAQIFSTDGEIVFFGTDATPRVLQDKAADLIFPNRNLTTLPDVLDEEGLENTPTVNDYCDLLPCEVRVIVSGEAADTTTTIGNSIAEDILIAPNRINATLQEPRTEFEAFPLEVNAVNYAYFGRSGDRIFFEHAIGLLNVQSVTCDLEDGGGVMPLVFPPGAQLMPDTLDYPGRYIYSVPRVPYTSPLSFTRPEVPRPYCPGANSLFVGEFNPLDPGSIVQQLNNTVELRDMEVVENEGADVYVQRGNERFMSSSLVLAPDDDDFPSRSASDDDCVLINGDYNAVLELEDDTTLKFDEITYGTIRRDGTVLNIVADYFFFLVAPQFWVDYVTYGRETIADFILPLESISTVFVLNGESQGSATWLLDVPEPDRVCTLYASVDGLSGEEPARLELYRNDRYAPHVFLDVMDLTTEARCAPAETGDLYGITMRQSSFEPDVVPAECGIEQSAEYEGDLFTRPDLQHFVSAPREALENAGAIDSTYQSLTVRGRYFWEVCDVLDTVADGCITSVVDGETSPPACVPFPEYRRFRWIPDFYDTYNNDCDVNGSEEEREDERDTDGDGLVDEDVDRRFFYNESRQQCVCPYYALCLSQTVADGKQETLDADAVGWFEEDCELQTPYRSIYTSISNTGSRPFEVALVDDVRGSIWRRTVLPGECMERLDTIAPDATNFFLHIDCASDGAGEDCGFMWFTEPSYSDECGALGVDIVTDYAFPLALTKTGGTPNNNMAYRTLDLPSETQICFNVLELKHVDKAAVVDDLVAALQDYFGDSTNLGGDSIGNAVNYTDAIAALNGLTNGDENAYSFYTTVQGILHSLRSPPVDFLVPEPFRLFTQILPFGLASQPGAEDRLLAIGVPPTDLPFSDIFPGWDSTTWNGLSPLANDGVEQCIVTVDGLPVVSWLRSLMERALHVPSANQGVGFAQVLKLLSSGTLSLRDIDFITQPGKDTLTVKYHACETDPKAVSVKLSTAEIPVLLIGAEDFVLWTNPDVEALIVNQAATNTHPYRNQYEYAKWVTLYNQNRENFNGGVLERFSGFIPNVGSFDRGTLDSGFTEKSNPERTIIDVVPDRRRAAVVEENHDEDVSDDFNYNPFSEGWTDAGDICPLSPPKRGDEPEVCAIVQVPCDMQGIINNEALLADIAAVNTKDCVIIWDFTAIDACQVPVELYEPYKNDAYCDAVDILHQYFSPFVLNREARDTLVTTFAFNNLDENDPDQRCVTDDIYEADDIVAPCTGGSVNITVSSDSEDPNLGDRFARACKGRDSLLTIPGQPNGRDILAQTVVIVDGDCVGACASLTDTLRYYGTAIVVQAYYGPMKPLQDDLDLVSALWTFTTDLQIGGSATLRVPIAVPYTTTEVTPRLNISPRLNGGWYFGWNDLTSFDAAVNFISSFFLDALKDCDDDPLAPNFDNACDLLPCEIRAVFRETGAKDKDDDSCRKGMTIAGLFALSEDRTTTPEQLLLAARNDYAAYRPKDVEICFYGTSGSLVGVDLRHPSLDIVSITCDSASGDEIMVKKVHSRSHGRRDHSSPTSDANSAHDIYTIDVPGLYTIDVPNRPLIRPGDVFPAANYICSEAISAVADGKRVVPPPNEALLHLEPTLKMLLKGGDHPQYDGYPMQQYSRRGAEHDGEPDKKPALGADVYLDRPGKRFVVTSLISRTVAPFMDDPVTAKVYTGDEPELLYKLLPGTVLQVDRATYGTERSGPEPDDPISPPLTLNGDWFFFRRGPRGITERLAGIHNLPYGWLDDSRYLYNDENWVESFSFPKPDPNQLCTAYVEVEIPETTVEAEILMERIGVKYPHRPLGLATVREIMTSEPMTSNRKRRGDDHPQPSVRRDSLQICLPALVGDQIGLSWLRSLPFQPYQQAYVQRIWYNDTELTVGGDYFLAAPSKNLTPSIQSQANRDAGKPLKLDHSGRYLWSTVPVPRHPANCTQIAQYPFLDIEYVLNDEQEGYDNDCDDRIDEEVATPGDYDQDDQEMEDFKLPDNRGYWKGLNEAIEYGLMRTPKGCVSLDQVPNVMNSWFRALPRYEGQYLVGRIKEISGYATPQVLCFATFEFLDFTKSRPTSYPDGIGIFSYYATFDRRSVIVPDDGHEKDHTDGDHHGDCNYDDDQENQHGEQHNHGSSSILFELFTYKKTSVFEPLKQTDICPAVHGSENGQQVAMDDYLNRQQQKPDLNMILCSGCPTSEQNCYDTAYGSDLEHADFHNKPNHQYDTYRLLRFAGVAPYEVSDLPVPSTPTSTTTATNTDSPTSDGHPSAGSDNTALVAGLVGGAAALLIITIAGIAAFMVKRSNREEPRDADAFEDATAVDMLTIDAGDVDVEISGEDILADAFQLEHDFSVA